MTMLQKKEMAQNIASSVSSLSTLENYEGNIIAHFFLLFLTALHAGKRAPKLWHLAEPPRQRFRAKPQRFLRAMV
jgi:hypothetical protein